MDAITETENLLVHCLRCDHEWAMCKLPILEVDFVDALRATAHKARPRCFSFAIRVVLAGPRNPALRQIADVVETANLRPAVTKDELIDQLMPILISAGLPAR